MKTLSIVIPVRDDCKGVRMTIQALRLYQDADIKEIIVVDNGTNKLHSEHTQGICSASNARYIKYDECQGTAAAKNKAISLATGDWALCLDSHVMLVPGAISSLLRYLQIASAETLIHGPILWDDLGSGAEKFEPEWRGEMFGIWASDERVKTNISFEVPGMGMGCFCVNTKFWPGFHKDFRGFGGEELYINEKYKKLGGKSICLSNLKWWHEFAKMDYAMPTIEEKIMNYIIGWRDLDKPLDDIYNNFVGNGIITQAKWETIIGGQMECATCPDINSQVKLQIASMQQLIDTPSDINEHLQTLHDLVALAPRVVEMGTRTAVSTTAFLTAKPKLLHTYDINRSPQGQQLALHAEPETDYKFIQGDSTQVEIEPCDLLFLDTDPHTADRVWAELMKHHTKVSRFIVFHDTQIFGEFYGSEPGVLPAVRRFQKEYPEWVTVKHYTNNNGLTVLSKNPVDYPAELPGLLTKAKNYALAMAKHIATGQEQATEELKSSRLAICNSNGGRCPANQHNIDKKSCATCGCPVEAKASWASSACPLGLW